MIISGVSCFPNKKDIEMRKNAISYSVLIVMMVLMNFKEVHAASLSGIFINELQQAQPSVSLEFHTFKNDSLVRKVTADSRGVFRVDSLMDGEYLLQIPAYDTFPLQWFSRTGNTRFAQFSMWIGPAMQYDTIKIILTMHPIENPPSGTIIVQVLDSTGQSMKKLSVELLRQQDMRQVGYIYNDTSYASRFTGVQPGLYTVNVQAPPYPRQYYDTVRNRSSAGYFFPLAVSEQKTVTVKLTMYPTGNGIIRGRCYTETALPASGLDVALFRATDSTMLMYRDTTDNTGGFSFENIIEESYFLRIQGGAYPVQWYSRQRGATVLYREDPLYSTAAMAIDTMKIYVSTNPQNNLPGSIVKIRTYSPDGKVESMYGKAALVAIPSQKYTTINFDPIAGLYISTPVESGLYGLGFSIPGYPYQFYNPAGNTAQDQYHFTLGKNETLFVETNLKRTFTDSMAVNYGYVSGVVRDSILPLRGVSITIFEKTGVVIGTAITDSMGKFSPIRVQNSVMYLKIDASGYPPQYWTQANGVPSSTISSINMFSVPTMTTMTTDIKVAVNPIKHWDVDTTRTGAQLSGQVATSSGPVRGARVLLINNSTSPMNSFSSQHLWSNFVTFTDSIGAYTLKNIPQGSYLVAAVADSLNLVTQFYKNVDVPKNALPVSIQNGMVSGINFTMRIGSIVKGSTIDSVSGAAIAGVKVYMNENIPDGKSFDALSDKNGLWEIRGVPSGEYNINFNHELLLQSGIGVRTVQVTEGKIIQVDPARFKRGGIIQGSVTFNGISMTDTMIWSMRGSLLLFSTDSKDISRQFPTFHAGVRFVKDTSNSSNVTFISSACPAGIYKAVFAPDPQNWGSTASITGTDINKKTLGYSFLNRDTSFQTASTITVTAGDTSRNNVIGLRSGYSVYGTISGDSTTSANMTNYNVTAFKKSGTVMMWVSSAQHLSNGSFEIPGLIDGEQYFIEMWADGYSNQFWSATGKNTTNPMDPFTLNVASGKLQLVILKKPEGMNIDMNRYIALRQPVDTNGNIKLQWSAASTVQIDTFFIHARNSSVTNTILAVVPSTAGKTQYEYVDNRMLSGWNEYCVTGHGPSMKVRSDILRYDLRQKSVSKGNLWIDVSGSRYGIAIEWGIADTIKFTERDSVYLYKRVPGGSYELQYSRSAWEMYLNDWKWNKSDSLKTFEYYVEIPSRGLRSSARSFTLDGTFFSQLPKEIRVGSGEKYTTIQSAINAAGENDNISVRPGIYNEQLSFKGKKLHLYGDWTGGFPPVIDASGGIAITVPFVPVSGYDGWNEISGFKINNAAVGVFAQANTHVNRCLFTNSTKSIKVVPDSAALASAVISNPFIEKGMNVNCDNCTFIASKAQSLIMSVQSAAVTTSSGNDPYNYQLLTPLKAYSAGSNISRSLFAYYGSIGGASVLPVDLTGSYSNVWINNSAVWQTPYQTLNTASIIDSDMVMYDPQFKDQIYYMCNDSSRLMQLGIGYSVRQNENNQSNHKELAAIKDLTMFNRSVNSIELRWSAAPVIDSVVRYRIYRVAGDPALFSVNSDSLWGLVSSPSSKGEVPSGVDTFSTDKLVYIDGTVVPGQPYLYVVTGVDRNGNESSVRISASKPISSYFTNVINYSIKVKADVWTMISPWGQAALNFENNPNVKIFQWDPQKTADKLLSHYAAVSTMIPGNGYWVKYLKDTTLTVSFNEPGKMVNVQDTLKCRILRGTDGWNQISSPFPHRVNPGLSSKYVFWEWMADSLGYKRVTTMEPWKAYWVYTEKDTSFIVNSGNNGGASTSMLSKRNSSASWELTVSLKSKSGVDPENICGVIPSGGGLTSDAELPEPPAAFNGNRLYFVNNDSGNGNTLKKLSYQYKPSEALPLEKLEWTIGIVSSEGPSEITFNGIQQCPKKLGLYWMYKGTVTDLRQQSSVTIDASSKETYGYLVATANPRLLALYTSVFTLRTPYPNPSNGRVVIEYVLPYQWAENGLKTGDKAQNVSVILYDLAGRTVKILVNSKVPAGKHTLMWDGRSQCGGIVGSGVYVLRFKSGMYVRNMQINRVR
jgi:hypothetical protein